MNKKITEEKGASMVEYAMLVMLIAVICVASVKIIGERLSTNFSSTADAFN